MKQLSVLFVLIQIFCFNLSAFKDSNEAIKAAAEAGSLKFIEKIPAGKEYLYGFSNRDEFKNITFGEPIEMLIRVKPEKVVESENLLDKDLLLARMNEWRFPVMVSGVYRAFVTVVPSGETYIVVDFGAAKLAEDLELFNMNHPALIKTKKYILRLHDITCDFLICSNKDDAIEDASCFPLESANKTLLKKNIKLNFQTTKELINELDSKVYLK